MPQPKRDLVVPSLLVKHYKTLNETITIPYLKQFVPWHHIGLALARRVLDPWGKHQGALQTLGQSHDTQQLVCLVAKPGNRFLKTVIIREDEFLTSFPHLPIQGQ